MPFTVAIQRRAQRDILVHSQRIESDQSFSVAMKWFYGVNRAIESLAEQPDRFPLANEADNLEFELRMMIPGKRRRVFRILYVIDGSFVHVLRVRHAAQDYLSYEELV